MRLINANILMPSFIEKVNTKEDSHGVKVGLLSLNDIKDVIDNAPTIDIPIRYKGEWIDRMADKGYVECPYCHKQITGGDLNFCVKCGAEMKKGRWGSHD